MSEETKNQAETNVLTVETPTTESQELSEDQKKSEYESALKEAEAALVAKDFEKAKAYFLKAGKYFPEDKHVKERITATDKMVDKEIKLYKDREIEFMKQQLPYLEMKSRYTRLMAEVEENGVRKVEGQLRMLQLQQAQQKAKMEMLIEQKNLKDKETAKNIVANNTGTADPGKGAAHLTVEKSAEPEITS